MNVTVFTQNLTEEKQAEGLAVSWAVVSGVCNICRDFLLCTTNRDFQPCAGSPCTKRKRGILEGKRRRTMQNMQMLLKQAEVLAVERRPEACLGCGFENSCSTHGCAVIKALVEAARQNAKHFAATARGKE